jgi:hypothetical protein
MLPLATVAIRYMHCRTWRQYTISSIENSDWRRWRNVLRGHSGNRNPTYLSSRGRRNEPDLYCNMCLLCDPYPLPHIITVITLPCHWCMVQEGSAVLHPAQSHVLSTSLSTVNRTKLQAERKNENHFGSEIQKPDTVCTVQSCNSVGALSVRIN